MPEALVPERERRVDQRIDVAAELGEVDTGEVAPGGDEGLGAHRGRGDRDDAGDGEPGMCDGQRLAGLDARDDLAAAVAQLASARGDPQPVENPGADPASHPLVSVARPAHRGCARAEGAPMGIGVSIGRTEQGIAVSRLSMADVEQLADDLHVELRAWTASSTQALSDFHHEDLAMMVDNATFNDRIEFRIATLDGRRAGIAVTRAGEHRGEPSTFVWWLAVDPAARRHGVARALVDDIEQDARERSHLLEGKVRADDGAAVAFWTALGWNPASIDPKASWIRRTAVARRR